MANRKRNVAYVDQEEPSFIRNFKQRAGYKKAADITDKFRDSNSSSEDDDRPVPEDEQPQVVVLPAKYTGARDTETEEDLKDEPEDPVPEDGRIKFKKPVKRSGENIETMTVSTKKNKSDDRKGNDDLKEKLKVKKKSQGTKNTKLLSFDADECEEDE